MGAFSRKMDVRRSASRRRFDRDQDDQRWGISESVREACITRLVMIVADPKQRPRTHIAAIKAILDLDRHNADIEIRTHALDAVATGSMPVITYASKEDMDFLRSLTNDEIIAFVRGGPNDPRPPVPARVHATPEARERAERSLANLEVSTQTGTPAPVHERAYGEIPRGKVRPMHPGDSTREGQ